MSHAPKRFDFSIPVRINLYSDTQSKPTPGMKDAMLNAEVGDEQGGSDPSVWELCDRVAALLGKEAAMFLPSGTMCNQVAIATHCRPGDEILAHEDAHIQSSEGGAPGAISGVMIKGLTGDRGMFTAEAVEEAIRPISRYSPPQKLVEVEQTANKGGGACWPVNQLREVAAAAHRNGMAVHMDGARLMNAAVALSCRRRISLRIATRFGSISPRGSGRRWVLCWPVPPTSSARPGDGSSDWAAPCARAG